MIATNKTFAPFLSRRPQIRSAHGVFRESIDLFENIEKLLHFVWRV